MDLIKALVFMCMGFDCETDYFVDLFRNFMGTFNSKKLSKYVQYKVSNTKPKRTKKFTQITTNWFKNYFRPY